MSSSNLTIVMMLEEFNESEMRAILTKAKINRNGTKRELINRILDLASVLPSEYVRKIEDLYNKRYSQNRKQVSRNLTQAENDSIILIEDHIEANHGNSNPMCDKIYRQNHYQISRDRTEGEGCEIMIIEEHIGTNYGNCSSPISSSGVSNFQIPNSNSLNVTKHSMEPSRTHTDLNHGVHYPVHSYVTFKKLPLYENLCELLSQNIKALPNERFLKREVCFYLTSHQIELLNNDPNIRVQLRMCLLNFRGEQNDKLPPSLCLTVNRYPFLGNEISPTRPQVDKSQNLPIDITVAIKKVSQDTNRVFISWNVGVRKQYFIGIYLVKKINSSVLLADLKKKGFLNPAHTVALIKKIQNDSNSEITSLNLKASLTCPISKTRMKTPCRALSCTHIQCFDAKNYFEMNEKRSTWICPICGKPAKNLYIDGLFLDVISQVPSGCNEIEFFNNGTWKPLKKELDVFPVSTITPDIEISLSSESDSEN